MATNAQRVQGVGRRECSSQSLPGGWRSRDSEHDGGGHGFSGWFAPQCEVPWTQRSSLHCIVTGQPDLVPLRLMERFSLSSSWGLTFDCLGRRCGSLVQGDPDFLPTSGPCEREVGTTLPRQGGTSMEIASIFACSVVGFLLFL